MVWQDWAMVGAGITGTTVGIIHGSLLGPKMIDPIVGRLRSTPEASGTTVRLTSALLHFSTFAWITGGLALVLAALLATDAVKGAATLFVGSQLLYGAIGNCWATRARHPGWLLMSVAVALLVVSSLR
ncbi:hypothetical protein SPAN111604_13240 [Sphingomonas antarctica]|uniref:hypothetical protein n=1 Tax=Sphingomonas antarctica TaxID=2040274 RepID=UPI0039EB5968